MNPKSKSQYRRMVAQMSKADALETALAEIKTLKNLLSEARGALDNLGCQFPQCEAGYLTCFVCALRKKIDKYVPR